MSSSSNAESSLLNENGRCFSFDERGSGYGRAEGVSVVVLKRLRDAVAANDPIHAVIRSTIAGSNGKTAGIMRPSETAQIEMIKAAYEKASLDPTDTGYIEVWSLPCLFVLNSLGFVLISAANASMGSGTSTSLFH